MRILAPENTASKLCNQMKKKIYATTSIAYVNDAPHLGYALELIQADAWVRFFRQQGKEVYFLTGVDEHGVKIVRTAEAQGKTPEQLVDENSEKFRDLKNLLNLSWDDFIRTSDKKRHWSGAQKIWQQLAAAGDIYKKKYRGLYCVGHEAFITEKDLVDGKCQDHQKEPEVIEEENWFFKLSKYSKEIEKRIKNDELKIIPESRKNEILSLLKEGLEDVSFSRPSKDLAWGVPVPDDETQTMYVWCDALVNYISAIGYGQPENYKLPITNYQFNELWPADIHFIGKDILRFHAAIWSAMLLSAGLELPKSIFVHGFITSNGQKMSKSIGNVVSPVELVEKYGVDAVRYYLLREIPSYGDGDFSYKKFEERYNGELANGLGNFSARVLTLASRDTNISTYGRSPEGRQIRANDTNKEILDKISETKKLVEQKIDEFKFNEAISAIWELISFGDNYVNQTKPWENPESKKSEIADLVIILENVAELISPFLPETSEKILKNIKSGKIIKGENLFPRLN